MFFSSLSKLYLGSRTTQNNKPKKRQYERTTYQLATALMVMKKACKTLKSLSTLPKGFLLNSTLQRSSNPYSQNTISIEVVKELCLAHAQHHSPLGCLQG